MVTPWPPAIHTPRTYTHTHTHLFIIYHLLCVIYYLLLLFIIYNLLFIIYCVLLIDDDRSKDLGNDILLHPDFYEDAPSDHAAISVCREEFFPGTNPYFDYDEAVKDKTAEQRMEAAKRVACVLVGCVR